MKSWLIALVFALLPTLAHAESIEPSDVQQALTRGGFDVDQVVHWSWTSPPMTTIRASEPGWYGRVLLVTVYSESITFAESTQGELTRQYAAELEQERTMMFPERVAPVQVVAGGFSENSIERFELAIQKPSMRVFEAAPSSTLAPSATNSGTK